MNPRSLLMAALLGGLTLFTWGAVSHMVIPMPQAVLEFPNPARAFEAIRAQVPSNGVYLDPRGIFVAAAVRPDQADKFANLAPALGVELASNVLAALLLAFVLAAVPGSALRRAAVAALAGMAASADSLISYWNWYGFSRTFVLEEAATQVMGWFVAGLVVAAVSGRPKEK